MAASRLLVLAALILVSPAGAGRERGGVKAPATEVATTVSAAAVEERLRRTFPGAEIERFAYGTPEAPIPPTSVHVLFDGVRDVFRFDGGPATEVATFALVARWGFPDGQAPPASVLDAWPKPELPGLRATREPSEVFVLAWEVPASEAKDLRALLTRWRDVRRSFSAHIGHTAP